MYGGRPLLGIVAYEKRMSIHGTCPILCSCGFEPDNWANWCEHNIADLYFCPHCKHHKCDTSCKHKIETKVCIGCNRDFTGTPELYCNRNCFVCPLCSSRIKVSASNVTSEDKPAKLFKFACDNCPYTYDTGVVTRPQPLRAILRGQLQVSITFRQFQKHWVEDQYDYGQKMSPASLSNLKLSNISIPQSELMKSIPIDEDEDKQALKSMGSKMQFDTSQPKTTSNLQPLARLLTASCSVSCSECNHALLLPKDSGPSLKWKASDYYPSISVIQDKLDLKVGSSNTLYFSIQNPLSEDINVSISFNEHIPKTFLKEGSIVTAIPVKSTTVTGSPKGTKNIPRHETRSYYLDSIPPETGPGWCILPLIVTVEKYELDKVHLQIPVHFSITTSRPLTVKVAGESTQIWKYGAWYLLDYGVFKVEQSEI